MKLLLNSILLVLIFFTSSYSDEAGHRSSAEEFLMGMKTDQMMQPIYQEIR